MRMLCWAAAAAVAFTVPAALHAQETEPQQAQVEITAPPKLAARAKISGDSAVALARAKVPAGHIVEGELEEESGKLIYSFDMRVPGQRGITEVHVNAITGVVAPIEHESGDGEDGRATRGSGMK